MRRSRRRGDGNLTPCGAINLNKPAGITSHDAVQHIRSLFQTRQVGHTGTLDPSATGVLPILLGPATRFSEYLLHLGKTYDVVAELGLSSDTQDRDGAVVSCSDTRPAADAVQNTLLSFVGASLQVPPMYSAVRIEGRRLHELAREGKTVERPARPIQVDTIDGFQYEYPFVSFRISVSSGTYVRTICHDLGQRLGCGAIMAELKRLVVGPLSLETSIPLEELSRQSEEQRAQAIMKLEELFAFLPAVHVLPDSQDRVGHGQLLGPGHYETSEALIEGQKVPILSASGQMLAVGEARRREGQIVIAPVRVLPIPSAQNQPQRRMAEAASLPPEQ